MKKIKQLILCILLCIPIFSGCSKQTPTYEKYSMSSTELGFDTVISFIAYTENEEIFQRYASKLKELFLYYDQLFSKYDTYSNVNNIKTINDHAGKQPVKVEQDLIDMLLEAKTYGTLSNYEFDITMGAVLNIWHTYRENAENGQVLIPTQEELTQAHTYTGWKHIQIDEKAKTVYIDNPNTQLDVGGVAKGYAVEKIAQKLEEMGCKHAIINGGGNIRIIGNKPETTYWSVGIQIPEYATNSTKSLLSVKIDASASFVTSGDYQRFYTYENQIMHHIIDPSTLQPARHCRSVTVISEDSGIADMLSTALFTLSHKDGQALLDQLKETKGIQAGAIWVYDSTQPKEDDTKALHIDGYDVIISPSIQEQIIQ